MKKRFDLKLENNPETSVSVVERYRNAISQEGHDETLALVHYRGGEEEFQIGKRYLSSIDPIDRALGADILAQLGWYNRTFLKESVDLLIEALKDEDENVVYCACIALGHRSDPRATPHVLPLINHTNEEIRCGVAFALLGDESENAVKALITLSEDNAREVRSWAVFGLASQIEVDNEDIRIALFNRATDSDHEVRGEALVGLAERNDNRVIELLLTEWQSLDDVGLLTLEAAELIKSPRLYDALVDLKNMLPNSNDSFTSQLESAIEACKPRLDPVR